MALIKTEFGGLLHEIWRIIFLLSDPKDVAKLRQVNKLFKQLADSIRIKEYYVSRPHTPLNLTAFFLDKMKNSLISPEDFLIPSLMKLYPSEILKRNLAKDFHESVDVANEKNYKKTIIKFNGTKNLMHTNDSRYVASLADMTRNTLIRFIQRENKLPKKLRWGTLISLYLITAGYFVFYLQANFIKDYPNVCYHDFSLLECQRQVDEFFAKSIILWFLAPTGIAATFKSVENALFKKFASKLINSLILPKFEHSYLSGTFRHYLGKVIEQRDYISLVMSLCLLAILKMSNMVTFDIKNCTVPHELISSGFDNKCLNTNIFRIDYHHIAPMSVPTGFLFAYSVMTLMMLTLTVAKKACAAFQDCYNSHGFLGRNRATDSTPLLERQADYSTISSV